MKKIILGLFLILGAVSFTMPNFINATKLQKAGYNIVEDSETVLTIADTDVVDGDSILVASFYLSDMNPQELSDTIKADAPAGEVKFLSAINNDQAYVNEFQSDNFYSYVVVPKKQKLGKYKIYATYATVKKLPKDAINSTVKSIINEAEGLIK